MARVELTTNRKGAIAELAIAKAALEHGIQVYRPVAEGGRYDLIFGFAATVLRVQCKLAPLLGGAIVVRCFSSRRSRTGFVRSPYTNDELDAFALYCPELERSYLIPFAATGGSPELRLRVFPAGNNQRRGIRLASDFEFAATLRRLSPGPIAQLGERRAGSAKVAGSSPAGSIRLLPSIAPLVSVI